MEWPEHFLTVRQTAELLSVCERTLRTMIADGRFPTVRVSRRRLGVDPRVLKAWIKTHRRGDGP